MVSRYTACGDICGKKRSRQVSSHQAKPTMNEILLDMLEKLEASYPETVKVPSQHGGYIRVPVEVNTEWYRAFCRRYMRSRRRYPKIRTIIKRCTTIAAMKRMLRGDRETEYAQRLLDFINHHYTGEQG